MAKGRFSRGTRNRELIARNIKELPVRIKPKFASYPRLETKGGGSPEGLRKAGETVRLRRVKITLPQLPPFKEDDDGNPSR